MIASQCILTLAYGQNVSIYSDTVYLDSSKCINTYMYFDDTTSKHGYLSTECFSLDGMVKLSESNAVKSTNFCNGYAGFLPNGVYKEYYSNGNLKMVKNYIMGRIEGLEISYYSNGQIQHIGQYKYLDNLCAYSFEVDTLNITSFMEEQTIYKLKLLSQKIGKWIYFYPTGELMRLEYYNL